jgi:protocatechuate 3,4-dioxygenase, beta subunit
MNQSSENRRDFLKRATAAVAAVPFLLSCRTGAQAQKADSELSLVKKNAITSGENWCGAIDVPDNVSSKSVLAKKTDKDEPMTISGTVFQPDGKTPASSVLIYFYHTDTEGFYGRGNGEPRHGHFRGWMLTDGQGRYEFSSIKPAAYPNRTFAAHVHMTLTGKTFREASVDSILFEGDRFITAQERSEAGKKGGFNPILKLEKGADGVWRGVRDIQLWKI